MKKSGLKGNSLSGKPGKKLSHLDARGRARMVDVSKKSPTYREAVAKGAVSMKRQTLNLISGKKIPKGDVFGTARLAGIMAAKKTHEFIPLCHPLNITSVSVDFNTIKRENRIDIEARVKCTGQTGVEMEALSAVSVAALTIYDMCKAADKDIIISDIMLLEKHGGKSGSWKRLR
jgi:cyclic pyranopterin phosphate synthase